MNGQRQMKIYDDGVWVVAIDVVALQDIIDTVYRMLTQSRAFTRFDTISETPTVYALRLNNNQLIRNGSGILRVPITRY